MKKVNTKRLKLNVFHWLYSQHQVNTSKNCHMLIEQTALSFLIKHKCFFLFEFM